jgi:hypothetical protein
VVVSGCDRVEDSGFVVVLIILTVTPHYNSSQMANEKVGRPDTQAQNKTDETFVGIRYGLMTRTVSYGTGKQ